MKLNQILLGVAAAAFFGAGILITRAIISYQPTAANQPAPVVVETQRQILVAARNLDQGVFLQAADMVWKDMPENMVRPSYFVQGLDDPQKVAGSAAVAAIQAGQPLERGLVVTPQEQGFLAAVLKPGLRAMSVAVDEVTGAAGLIFPGDYVDVIVTAAIPENLVEPGRRIVGETVLTNVRVLATDRTLRGPADRRVTDKKAEEEAANHAPPQPARTVTLELTATGAQQVAVAAGMGRIVLALRSLKTSADGKDRPAATFGGQVVTSLGALKTPEPPAPRDIPASPGVTVLRGGAAAAKAMEVK